MAITKLSNSGIYGDKYISILAGNAAFDPAATWLIQRVAGTTSSATISFTSIPQTYQHLQLRIMARGNNPAVGSDVFFRVNSDTASNYSNHSILGDGSSATAGGAANMTSVYADYLNYSITGANATASVAGAIIIDIHDYASTTKNKTIRIFGGYDNNGAGNVYLSSGLWRSTNAITSIDAIVGGGNWTTLSTFALYGFKGA